MLIIVLGILYSFYILEGLKTSTVGISGEIPLPPDTNDMEEELS